MKYPDNFVPLFKVDYLLRNSTSVHSFKSERLMITSSPDEEIRPTESVVTKPLF